MNVEEMRDGRQIFQSVYLDFLGKSNYYKTHVFCFYEGEDGKYYDSRIRSECSENIMTFRVQNKTGVLKLYEKIKNEHFLDDVCKMFFIDRDCDENKYDGWKDLYVTPGYSIENFYVSQECLAKILQSEFGINPTDDDFKKCINDYVSREEEFNNIIFEFNLLVRLRRYKNISNNKCSFGDVKTSSLVRVDLNRVIKSDKYDNIMDSIKLKLGITIDDIEFMREKMKCENNYSNIFRGKNQMDFFVEFLKKLKRKNKAGGYLSKKYNCVHLEITSNRLSELSQYANTDVSLINFIKTHKTNLEANRAKKCQIESNV